MLRRFPKLGDTEGDAFEQHPVLVSKVPVNHRLGDAKRSRDVIEGGGMEAPFIEHAHRSAQQRVALL